MTKKEKILKRLKKMGLIESSEKAIVFTHQYSGRGGFSWIVSEGSMDIGCCTSMTEALKWKRWLYSSCLHEIFNAEGQSRDESDLLE